MNAKKLCFSLLAFLLFNFISAQVGVGNTNPQASLDISASSTTSPANNDGILIPRMSAFPSAPGGTRDGLLIFYTGTGADGKGFYYWDQPTTTWIKIAAGNTADVDWFEVGTTNTPDDINDNIFTQGNVGIGSISPNAKLHIDGTTTPLRIDVSGTEKLSFRNNALEFLNNGNSIFIGEDAGLNDDLNARQNIAIGFSALRSNINQNQNIAIGNNALRVNTAGDDNIAIGDDAMSSSTGGRANVSLGVQTLFTNISGNNNVAIGSTSLRSNTSSDNNVAIGYRSLYNTTTGGSNSAIGFDAGFTNSAGQNNVYLGNRSGYLNTGSNNVFLGYHTGYNETGSNKLYIDNSNTATPLIYGEFDTNLLRVNGELQVGDSGGTGYAFPVTDGVLDQVLTTDGNGQISFSTPRTWVEKIDDLLDGKSDNDGTQNGSSLFLGIDAGASDDSSDNRNIGIGYLAMEDNTTGFQNTAIGYHALLNNVDGNNNTAVGSGSLDANVDGIWNTAIGQGALSGNTNGAYNTALGRSALVLNQNGNSNVALGVNAYAGNTSGSFNTVIGVDAATGLTASSNTIIGRRAMNSYTAGGENVAIGASSGYYGNGIRNTYIGTAAGFSPSAPTRNGSVFIGYAAGSSELTSNKLYIENTSADADNALVYGEFGSDDTSADNILRTNSQFQIGNPTGTGYAFPTTDGANGEVLTTDGNGNLGWTNPSGGASASNGLTATSGDISLGGILTQNTIITQGAFDLNFDLTDVAGNFTVGNTALVVESSGDVGLGIANPAYDLDVYGDEASTYVANFRNNSSSLDADGIAIRLNSGTSSNGRYIDFYRSGGNFNSGSVRGNGSGVVYATTSDRRLKTNIQDIENALEKINALQPRVYEYKEFPGTKEMGFIAQELQIVYPQAVSGDESGDPKTNPMLVDYSRLTPILAAGIKELNEKVETLSEENKKLKQQLSKLQQLETRLLALENSRIKIIPLLEVKEQ